MRNSYRSSVALSLCLLLVMVQFPPTVSGLAPKEEHRSHTGPVTVASGTNQAPAPWVAYAPKRLGRFGSMVNRFRPASAQGEPQPVFTNLPGQTSTLLPDGRVLILGGENRGEPMATGFIKDSATGAITQLSNTLLYPRAYHTATVLPDGSVFIFGGLTVGGAIETTAETLDLTSLKFTELAATGLTPRSLHTATVLTDGSVLVAGGVLSDGEVSGKIEFWNPRNQGATVSQAQMLTPRKAHTASLQPDGSVLFWGGNDRFGNPLTYGEVFDPLTQNLRIQTSQPLSSEGLPPFVEASIPQDGDQGVRLDSIVAVRFSHPLEVQTLTVATVTLSNSDSPIPVKVVPAEGGMLVFVTPQNPLVAGAVYSLLISEPTDTKGALLQSPSISFTTANANSSTTPVQANPGMPGILPGPPFGKNPFDSPWRKLPSLTAPAGVTAVAGQALRLDGSPLERVTLQIGSLSARTDETGRFLMENVPSGHQVMWIDGSTTERASYGIFEVGVDVTAATTNSLKYTIWMTQIDTAHTVRIPSPTRSETVVTSPVIPGLELHIPPQATILDRDGKVVKQLTITQIPVTQPPFPLPNLPVPLYFTVQPGGAYIQVAGTGSQGVQLYYPNGFHNPAGTPFDFYDYDADSKGWYVYGQGKVNANQAQIVPNPGVSIYEFTGAMVVNPVYAPADGPKANGQNPQRGEPVDLGTGLFVYRKTDLLLPDVIPIVLTRTYRQRDPISRAFGIGTNDSFDFFLIGDAASRNPEGWTYQDLVLPDGGRIRFERTSPCSTLCGYAGSTYAAVPTGTDFDGATIHQTSGGFPNGFWTLTKKDGTAYGFPDSEFSTARGGAPVGMRDRYGNTVTFTRDSNSNLTQITSPNGRWIQFTYDTSNRVTQAQDNIGRIVKYTYDSGGRLSTVTDANGGVTAYTYDSNNNMLTIQDPRQIVYLTNYYDSNMNVILQVGADSSFYQFFYTFGSNGNIIQTKVIDPNNNQEQVLFNSDGYVTSDTLALGKPEQQVFSYQRQPGSGLLLSMTDPLNRQTQYTYDPLGNLTSTTRLAGTSSAVTTSFTYDPVFSQLTSATDPLGHTTSFAVDNRGNTVAVADPLGNTTTLAYNTAGQPTSIANPVGNATQFSYDSGDLVGVTDPLGRTQARFLDSAGRLLSATNSFGQITKYTYDNLNELTSIIGPNGNTSLLSYDPNGNVLSVTDANNHPTQYTFDNMDRLLTRKDPLGNSESYKYDGNGNVTQFTDRRGKIAALSYDGVNRRSFAGFGQTGGSYESTINYTYDGANRLTQTLDSTGGTITNGYDGLDRLTSQATPQGSVSYTYDATGRRQTMVVAGQSTISYTFDAANRLSQISQGASVVKFGYDFASRRTSLTLPNGIAMSYGYDSASQLTGITYMLGTNTLGNLTYSYDLTGRRTSMGGTFAQSAIPLAIGTTSYNANNQLTQWGSASLFYDANGNMTSDGTNSYVWNARNQLASMDLGAYSFQYDAFGRRTSKTVSGATKSYVYDVPNVVQELSGSTPTANLLTGGIDEVFTRTDSSGAANFLADALGSTLALTNSSGSTLAQYAYEPFGNTFVTSGSSANPYEFDGRENDGIGIYLYRNRYYSSVLDRFISEDPIRFAAGSSNLYEPVYDDPTNFIDPFGFQPDLTWSGPISGWVTVSGSLAMATGSVTVDSFWGVHLSYGVSTPGANFSWEMGHFNSPNGWGASEDTIQQFLGGTNGSICGGFVVGGCEIWSPDGQSATTIGFTSPTLSASLTGLGGLLPTCGGNSCSGRPGPYIYTPGSYVPYPRRQGRLPTGPGGWPLPSSGGLAGRKNVQ